MEQYQSPTMTIACFCERRRFSGSNRIAATNRTNFWLQSHQWSDAQYTYNEYEPNLVYQSVAQRWPDWYTSIFGKGNKSDPSRSSTYRGQYTYIHCVMHK